MNKFKSGFFSKEEGGYVIKNDGLVSSYQYFLLGKKVLVCLDQNGIEKIQVDPPCGAVFVRRENGEKYSKWLTFIVHEGKKYCNFSRPSDVRPNDYTVEFLPEKATYRAVYDDFTVVTEIFAALDESDAVCSVKIINTSGKMLGLKVFSAAYPFDNMPNVSAWDIPYWYLRTSVSHDESKNVRFFTRLVNPRGEAEKRRNFCFSTSGKHATSAEYYMDRYIGADDFYAPESLKKDSLSYDFSQEFSFAEMSDNNSIAGFQPVYCTKYDLDLSPSASERFTQVFSFLSDNGGDLPEEKELTEKTAWFDEARMNEELKALREFYRELFSVMRVSGGDLAFDDYVNSFLPLQLRWVGALDRGWATGMRGTRDSANDYMALMVFQPEKARETLLHLFECQRSDGWFPRQVGESVAGPHDMRAYVDGGVFVLEFLYEYICYTKDFGVLNVCLPYLDDKTSDDVVGHTLRTLDYYVDPENVGEDGLLKIREGDWFDGVNRAGIYGKGESVTVSCQFYMAVKYVAALFEKVGVKIDLTKYLTFAEELKKNINEKAYNASGFYNGVRNDSGEWIFSDCDPDGKSRMFAVPNAFAIVSGVADEEKARSVLQNFKKLKTRTGYKLFETPFEKKLNNVGRVASGDVISGLLGNYTVYNHGSQGFLTRACLNLKDYDFAKDVLMWSLPYDQSRHPEEETLNAPYAIVNCYQDVAPCRHRVGFSFLTGTVAMIFRNVYFFMYGIKPSVDGLTVDPCLGADRLPSEVSFGYRGMSIKFEFAVGEKAEGSIDGVPLGYGKDVLTGRRVLKIDDDKIHNNSVIKITVDINDKV